MESRESYLKQIQTAIEQRDFHRAIQLANEALAKFADDPEILKLRQVAQDRIEAEPFLQSFMSSGISLFNSGLYQDALKQFEKVATIDPTYPELQEWIERTREELGATGAPAGVPSEGAPAVELSPSQQKVQELLDKGQQLFERGEFQEAIQVWSEVFMYDLTNDEAQKRIQMAQQSIQKKRTTIEQVLADLRAAMKANDWPRAEELVQQALQIDPEHPEALQFKETLQKRAQAAQAHVEAQAVVSAPVSEDEMDQLVMQALQAHREGRWEEAVKLWQQVLQHDPENIGAQTKYSEALRQLRLESQVLKLIRDARTFMAADKRDSAIHALQKAYRMRSDHPEVLNLMLEWNLTEADMEEFEIPSPATAPAAEPRKTPTRLLLLVGTVVFAGVAFLVYWQFIRNPAPAAETAQIPAPQRTAPSRQRPQTVTPPPTPAPVEPRSTEAPAPASENQTPPPKVELTPAQARRRDQLIAQAQKDWREGHLDQALKVIQQALEIDPSHPQANQLQKSIAGQIEQRESAIRERLNLAIRYANSYDFEGAIFVLNQMRSQYPQRAEIFEALKRAYYDLGIFYLRQVRCGDALAIFEQITLMDPKEKRFQDLTPMARRCVNKNGLTAEDQRRLYSMEFLPLIENPSSP